MNYHLTFLYSKNCLSLNYFFGGDFMLNLVEFFEKQTNKNINIVEYNNQELGENKELVKFNNKIYMIEFIDNILINKFKGHFYIIFQNNIDGDSLKRVLYNLYEDINIFIYKKYLIINSNEILNIDKSTPEIIESETYRNTFIFYLGKMYNKDLFLSRISILDEVLEFILKYNNSKFLNLNDLMIYKIISSTNNKNIFDNLIDYENIRNIDENLLHTGLNFIENDLNISKTSNTLFLHRNTLIYRLEKIKESLNLDLKNFKDALVFYISIKTYLLNK